MTNLMDKINQGREEAVKAGHAEKNNDWFKFVEGENRIRIMTIFEPIYEDFKNGICFTDCGFTGTPKYMCYVLDMKEVDIDGQSDPKLKLAKLPASIAEEIATLQQDADWGFNEFPAPYDIKIIARGAGTKEVDYKVIASPNRTEVDGKYVQELSKKKSVLDIVKILKEKNAEKHGKVLPHKQAEMESLAAIAEQQGSIESPDDYPDGYPDYNGGPTI